MKKQTIVILIIAGMIVGILRSEIWSGISTLFNFGNTIADSNIQTIAELKKKNAEQFINYQKLDSAFSIAQSRNISDERTFQELQSKFFTVALNGKGLSRIVDSLRQRNMELVSISQGIGHGNISGGGKPDSINKFSDNWITAQVTVKDNKLHHMEYDFSFRVGEVRAIMEDEYNNQTELYEVYLQSEKDTTKILYVGDYRRNIVNQKPYFKMFDFWNPRLNIAGLIGGKTLEGEVSVSLMTFGTSNEAKNILFLFPDIGLSSNFKDQNNITAGIRFNAAHFIPLVTNIHVKASVGIPMDKLSLSNALLRVGVGATL